jgi:hypothetical protein
VCWDLALVPDSTGFVLEPTLQHLNGSCHKPRRTAADTSLLLRLSLRPRSSEKAGATIDFIWTGRTRFTTLLMAACTHAAKPALVSAETQSWDVQGGTSLECNPDHVHLIRPVYGV